MSDMTDRPYRQDVTSSPDTPYEHKVCGITLICSLAFLATCAYFLLSPQKDGLMMVVMAATGTVFGLAMLNFFIAAFRGKLCGCKKQE